MSSGPALTQSPISAHPDLSPAHKRAVEGALRWAWGQLVAAGSQLRPGMFARAEIAVGAQPAATVPTGAVLYRNNQAGVFLLNSDSSVRFQPITVLSRTDAQTAVNGVAAGARVVVDGAGFLNEGDRVTVSTGAARPAAQPAPQPAAQPAAK